MPPKLNDQINVICKSYLKDFVYDTHLIEGLISHKSPHYAFRTFSNFLNLI